MIYPRAVARLMGSVRLLAYNLATELCGIKRYKFVAAYAACSALLFGPVLVHSKTCTSEDEITLVRKCHAIKLLKKLRLAVDTGAVASPKKLHEVTGIEMLDWHRASERHPFHRAISWRFHDPVLDDKTLTFGKSVNDGLRYVFGESGNDAYPASLSFMDFSKLACISVSELTEIFGKFDIQTKVKPLPFHGSRPPPYKTVSAIIEWKESRGRVNMLFFYESENNPVPTCLKVLTISLVGEPTRLGK